MGWTNQQLSQLRQRRAGKTPNTKPKPSQKKSDSPAPPRPTMMNKNNVLIGFDADVQKCGLCLYDVPAKKVHRVDSLHFNDISEWLKGVKEVHGERLYARVELGDNRSIYGATKAVKGQVAKFNICVKSGRSLQVANLFISLLERYEIRYEIIDSSMRFNIENRKLPKAMVLPTQQEKYVDLSPKKLYERFRLMNTIFPSKLKANHIKAFFELEKTGNSETRDALSLCIPEVLFFKNKK